MSIRSSAVSRTPRVVVGLLVAAFAIALIATGFASADTMGTSLTVTPSSGLTDGQSVALSGSGYTPGASGTVSECGNNAANGIGCTTIGTLSTDGSGNLPAGTTVNVQKTFTAMSGPANGTTIDCATDACWIDVSAYTTNATKAISFAAPPVLNPAVTVTPNTNLPSPTTVNVSGTGFPAGGTTNFFECKTVSGVVKACAPVGSGTTTNGSGAFGPTSVPVTANFTPTQGDLTPVDCRVDTCVVNATVGASDAFAPISFAPLPPAATPAVTVTPNANLSASQNVNVSGTGFPAGATTNFFQCKTVDGVVKACAPIGTGTMTDNTGAFGPVAVPVTRTFTPTQGDLTPVDCRVDTCVVDASAAGVDAFAPIHFASTQGPGVLTVTPNSNLTVPSQQVTVSGTHFSDQASVSIFECKPNTPVQSCVLIGTAFTDNNGNFSTMVTVTEAFTATSGTTGPVNCLPENNCNVAASDPGGREGVAGITFAVNSPTTLAPTTTTTTAPESRICASLRAARARYNASLDRVIALSPAFIRPILEAGRAAGNAGYDLSLRLAGCAPVNVNTQRSASVQAAGTTRAAAVSAAPAAEASSAPRTYTVAVGDSLSKIARQVLGNASAYPVLAQLNGIANPSLIHPGQVLQLPA